MSDVDSAGLMACLPASDAFAMRMSSLIAALNPMTETTNPARLIQSPTLMVIGSPALIIDRGRATFTLFRCDTTFCAGRDRRASVVPLPSATATSHQPDGLCIQVPSAPAARTMRTTASAALVLRYLRRQT